MRRASRSASKSISERRVNRFLFPELAERNRGFVLFLVGKIKKKNLLIMTLTLSHWALVASGCAIWGIELGSRKGRRVYM